MMKKINRDENRKKQYRRTIFFYVMVFFMAIFVSMPMVANAIAPTAPTVAGTAISNSSTPTWTWTAGGGGNGSFRVSFDNATWTTTSALTYTPTALADGSHTLYVQELDVAGNWSSSGSFAIVIDSTSPTVTSVTTAAIGTYTAGQSIDFTVNYSEPVNVNLPLDRVSGSAGAYGLRKLKSDFTGSAIRVRRSSDNTEQNIGFVGSELDTTSLSSFVYSENLNKQSEAFTVTWNNSLGITVTDNQTTAPNGTNTAATVYETATTALHQPHQLITSTTGSAYTYSMYVKDGNRRYFRLRVNYGSDTFYAIADLQSGTIVSGALGAATIIGATITPSTNGFYRITVTGSCPHENVFYGYGPYYQATYGTDSYAGDASKYLYVWGAQSNSGTSANIYNKTVAVAGIVGNGYVTTWYDQSGNGRNFEQTTAASQPQVVLNAQNGKATVRYDGVDDTLQGNAAAKTISKNVGGLTAVTVAKYDTVTSAARMAEVAMYTGGGNGRFMAAREANGLFSILGRRQDSDGLDVFSGGMVDTKYMVKSSIANYSSASGYIYRNGILVASDVGGFTSAGNTDNTDSTNLYIGHCNGSEIYDGDIAEVILYPTALADADRQLIERNQGTYFAIGNDKPLDKVGGAAAAYGLRTLLTGYNGALVKIRKDSDNTTSDFYADGFGELSLNSKNGSSVSLGTWIGTASGYVDTWYDQSGNGNNATKSTTANQPKIVTAGTLQTKSGKPAIWFDGSNDFLEGVGYDYGADGGMTLNTISATNANQDNPVGNGYGMVAGFDPVTANQMCILAEGNLRYISFANVGWPGWNVTLTDNTPRVVTAKFTGTNLSMYGNGTLTGSPAASGIDQNHTFKIGGSGGYRDFEGNIMEVILYQSAIDDTQRGLVERDQMNYFSIKKTTDNVSDTAAAAYGLRKLRTAYTGSAIKVLRSSDNTKQDIGFTASGDLDTNALTKFVGSENLLKYSETLDNTSNWSVSNPTSTASTVTDQAIAPDGTLTADKYTATSASNWIYQMPTLTANTDYTLSFYVKNVDAMAISYGVLKFSPTSSWIKNPTNPSNNYISSINTNTWTRIQVTFNSESGTGWAIYPAHSISANKSVYIWGVQVNKGTVANTYNKTVAGIGGNGYVTTWYDQTTNGRNATQATATNQPRIVNAGTVEMQNGKPRVYFDGSNDTLAMSAFTAATIDSVFDLHTAQTGFRGVAASNTGMIYARESVGANWGTYSSGTERLASSTLATGKTYLSTINNGSFYLNGASDGTYASTSGQTGHIGGTSGQNVGAYIGEVLMYTAAIADTDRQIVEADQMQYFGINKLAETEPTIAINLNGTTRTAMYVSGSGTNTHTYRYIVQPGDNDANGIDVTSPISGGTNKDNAGNDATLTFTPTTTSGIMVDTTEPTNVGNWPKADTATATSITVRANTNEAGTAYYVVMPNNSTTPTSMEVKNATAVGQTTSGNFALTANTEGSTTATGLIAGTQYDVYVVTQDTAGNLQASPTKVDAATFAGGAGTVGSPWQVKWPENLNDVRTRLSGVYYIQVADIDVDSVYSNFEPISTSWSPFNYEGGGYKITDLVINLPTQDYVSLFGKIGITSLNNIRIENANITGKNYAGILVGIINGGDVSNCYANGTVTGITGVGGLVGRIYSGTVIKSYVEATVSGTSQVGGLSGVISLGGSVSDSYATGNIIGNTNQKFGGLAGDNAGSITNSYATGSVSGTGTVKGGLVGSSTSAASIINNSYALESALNLVSSDAGTTTSSTTKSAVQLKQQATFSGWDFANTWAMNEGLTYPVLKGMQLATVQSVTLPTNKTYKLADTMSFILTFNNNITMTGTTSNLALTIGSNARTASYLSKTANSVTYRYTVVADDLDSDGITMGAVTLNGDTLVDASANQAYMSFGTQTTTGILVDGVKPTIPTVTMASNYTDTTRAHVGNVVTLSFTASEAINTPTVTIATTAATVNDAGDSDPTTWKATYTMLNGNTEDLIAFTLNFTDLAGNAGTQVTAVTTGTKVVFNNFAGGDGSSGDPYLVANPTDLKNVRNNLTLYFRQSADIDLGVAPWNVGSGWLPIGNTTAFSGNYDGYGYKIANLTINRGGTVYVALFGQASTSAVLNRVVLTNISVLGGGSTGGLLGIGSPTITNCSSTGSVSGADHTGGLVGSLNVSGLVQNCYSTATVRTSTGVAGGLVSWSCGTIKESYATGNVTAGTDYAGGLIGHTNGGALTQDCYATGTVNGVDKVGGLVGQNRGGSTIRRSYARGFVTGTSSTGGLVGNNIGTIENNCYYDSTTGQSDTGKGTLTTTVAMMTQSTYTSWDFASTWAMNEGLTCPVIKSMQALTVSAVTLPANKTYKIGDALSFTLTFNANMTMTGTASTLPLTIGSTTRTATYTSKTANSVTYRYTIVEGDTDSDGIAMGVVTLNGDTLEDASANQAYMSFGPQVTTGILVDGVKPTTPTVTMASNYTDTTRAHVGNVVTLSFTASEAINTPTVTIATTAASVNNAGDLDPTTWKATYTMVNGDTEDLITFTLNFTDIAGNAGTQVTAVTSGTKVVFNNFAGGDGSSGDPYLVANATDLNNVRNNLTLNFRQTADIDLGVAPWNVGSGWLPIGDATNKFTGSYNGGGYKITNLTINRSLTDYVGLFSYTSNTASLNGMILKNVNIVAYSYSGVLVATNGGSITNCGTEGTFSSAGRTSGFVSENEATGIINKCYSAVNISGNWSLGGFSVINYGTISNSYVTGSTTATGGSGMAGQSALGFSDATGNVINCYSVGAVTSSPIAAYNFGIFESSTVTKTFWNSETCLVTSGKGTGKTTAQMKQQATYSGWDFASTWAMNEGLTYPVLKSMQALTVSTVTLPANKTYKIGDALSFTLTFNANMTMTGAASTLPLTIGSTVRTATYISKTANSVTYKYTIVEGDSDLDGISMGVVTLNGDTLLDASANQAYMSFGPQVITGILADGIRPTVVLLTTVESLTSAAIIPITVTFSENFTLTSGSILTSNCLIDSISGSGTNYTVIVTPISEGRVYVRIGANEFFDAAGNGNTESNLIAIRYRIELNVEITTSVSMPTILKSVPITITFAKSVTGFAANDITVINGTKSSLAGSGSVYTMEINPTNYGTVTIYISADIAFSSNGDGNLTSNILAINYTSTTWNISNDGKTGSGITMSNLLEPNSMYYKARVRKDFVFDADVRINSGGSQEGGLVFRRQDKDNYYAVVAKVPDLIELIKVEDSTPTILATTTATISGYNNYMIEANGTSIKVYINNASEPSIVVYDNTFSEGKIGLYSNLSSVSFDNVRVSSVQSKINPGNGELKEDSGVYNKYETGTINPQGIVPLYVMADNRQYTTSRAINNLAGFESVNDRTIENSIGTFQKGQVYVEVIKNPTTGKLETAIVGAGKRGWLTSKDKILYVKQN